LREDTPKPDQEVEELPGRNVDGKPVAGTSFLQGLNLALNPQKDSVEKIFRGLYVATLSIKLRCARHELTGARAPNQVFLELPAVERGEAHKGRLRGIMVATRPKRPAIAAAARSFCILDACAMLPRDLHRKLTTTVRHLRDVVTVFRMHEVDAITVV
jgi:hypothetical protein